MYFNPRTREGCDDRGPGAEIVVYTISIHAPVKGATFARAIARGVTDYISIHAPVKGATLPGTLLGMSAFYFNPRTREGCDTGRQCTFMTKCQFQSTHP